MSVDIDPQTALAVKTRTPRGRFLTAQESRFVTLCAQGLPASKAAKGAGYAESAAPGLLASEAIAETLTALKLRQTDSLEGVVTRDFVGGLLLDAHKRSATATEEINAARELGKLYGVYAPEKTQTQVDITYTRVEQLEGMTDAQLLRLSEMPVGSLSPAAHRLPPLEGECEEADD